MRRYIKICTECGKITDSAMMDVLVVKDDGTETTEEQNLTICCGAELEYEPVDF